MARPQKNGLDYFPLDVDMDANDKISLIEAEYGLIGFGVVVRLYMKIYKSGYYYEWNQQTRLLFSSKIKTQVDLVDAILEKCLMWNIFDKKKFEEFSILTSRGIQSRFFGAINRRRPIQANKDFIISSVNVNINNQSTVVNVDNNEDNDVKKYTKKRKEKEIKEKEKKKYLDDSTEMHLAKTLLKNLRDLNPNFKEPIIENWCSEFDLILRVDKRQPTEIHEIMNWVKANNFWCKNILSPTKLRKQFDRLTMEVKNDNGKNKFQFPDRKYSAIQ